MYEVFQQRMHPLGKFAGRDIACMQKLQRNCCTSWRWKACRTFSACPTIAPTARPYDIASTILTAQGRTLHPNKLVPESPPPSAQDLNFLCKFVERSQRLVVLTGAGASTESGIPDYRSPNGAYNTGFKPMTHQEFVRSVTSRQRYWARSYVGWRRFLAALPGPTHKVLSKLEERSRIFGIITQNVDRLHHKAGSNPIELHGTTHVVVCLECGDLVHRQVVQEKMKELNSEWSKAVEMLEKGEAGSDVSFGLQQRPDGDIEIKDSFNEAFNIPHCDKCGGMLKPDVVFFGDNVPQARVDAAKSMIQAGDSLFVVGSSVMVMSAFRLVRLAKDCGLPVAILNIGPTRADELASIKVEARSGEVLPRLLSMLSLNVHPI
ncbi:hypothetical protein O6H91_09G037400 [Diphasiastrum complanatum]|nr:hypothetical protein O6H91_09G037400 [Diphasiastrum complanatum]